VRRVNRLTQGWATEAVDWGGPAHPLEKNSAKIRWVNDQPSMYISKGQGVISLQSPQT